MRPQNYGSTFTLRLPVNTRAAIKAAAASEDTSASDWIRRALASIVKPSVSCTWSPSLISPRES